ncbi:MAG: nucleotidyl transferase AbiEii/AbiGii toxin family protein [Myxococcota bacterium]
MKLKKDFREFIQLFHSMGVEYVLVGGYAVACHGFPRFTGDIDFFVRSTRHNAERIKRALDAFGFADTGLTLKDISSPGTIVQLGIPPNRIDIITEIDGVTFDEAWATRQTVNLGGVDVQVVSADVLLKNKRASGRPKDLLDVVELEKVLKR